MTRPWAERLGEVASYVLVSFLLASLLLAGCSRSADRGAPASVFAQLAEADLIDGLTREQAEGRRLFFHYCAVCHGQEGRGDGFNSFNLQNSFGVTPADLSQRAAELEPERLQQAIAGGGPAVGKSRYMPPWGSTVDAAQIHALAAYVTHLGGGGEAAAQDTAQTR